MKPKYILIDIEGTLSDINFVHKVLFPYAKDHLPTFLQQNWDDPKIQEQVGTLSNEKGVSDLESVVHQLDQWISEDVKHPVLKSLQGMVWKTGFESGEFKSHIYQDVVAVLREWREAGIQLAIYSSGSVAAQLLFFKHTEQGDLLDYFEHNFDLQVGSKKEVESYSRISHKLAVSADEILFLSDVDAELEAAEKAGMMVTRLVRPGTESTGRFKEVSDFTQIRFNSN